MWLLIRSALIVISDDVQRYLGANCDGHTNSTQKDLPRVWIWDRQRRLHFALAHDTHVVHPQNVFIKSGHEHNIVMSSCSYLIMTHAANGYNSRIHDVTMIRLWMRSVLHNTPFACPRYWQWLQLYSVRFTCQWRVRQSDGVYTFSRISHIGVEISEYWHGI